MVNVKESMIYEYHVNRVRSILYQVQMGKTFKSLGTFLIVSLREDTHTHKKNESLQLFWLMY